MIYVAFATHAHQKCSVPFEFGITLLYLRNAVSGLQGRFQTYTYCACTTVGQQTHLAESA